MTRVVRPAIVASLLLAGCHAEGRSYLLQASEPRQFASIDACIVEAKAKHEDGSQKYAGYVCVHKLLFVELSRQEFYDGKTQASTVKEGS